MFQVAESDKFTQLDERYKLRVIEGYSIRQPQSSHDSITLLHPWSEWSMLDIRANSDVVKVLAKEAKQKMFIKQ